MACATFERQLPLLPFIEGVHSVGLRQLITHCLSDPLHPLMHLAALSMFGGVTAGARQLIDDPSALSFPHYEYFGRPFSAAAWLWADHKPLLDDLIDAKYAQRHGKAVAAHVQMRVLRDVVVPDLACVVSNARRPPDKWVIHALRRLARCPLEEVSRAASSVRVGFEDVARSGMATEHDPVASEDHMEQLLEMLDDA